jgi:hypothetical protein
VRLVAAGAADVAGPAFRSVFGAALIQIVSPERLREILDADGETYEPPSGFDSDDEWEVAS